ncbi:MAG: hypothetical protein WCT85_01600 [Parachlamydiales bacterium]|jgi:hypothetical protein
MNLDISKENFSAEQLFKIEAEFLIPVNYDPSNFQGFVSSMEKLLFSFIPKDILNDLNNQTSQESLKSTFLKIFQYLPIISHTEILNKVPFCFSFSILCLSDLMQGINKFNIDMLNKWLVPGKTIDISSHRSLQFKFKNFTNKSFYLSEYFINISSEKELNLIKKNLSSFINEIKLIILSVYHARQIISVNKLSNEQKSLMIKENLSSLLKNPLDKNCAFDQMGNFVLKLSEEKKLNEIQENLAFLMYKKPQTFDRDIFNSLHNKSLIFRGNFSTLRKPKHLSKILAYEYFFKKSIETLDANVTTKKRIVSIKLIRTTLIGNQKPVLGVLIVMNHLNENEYFERNYVLESITQIIKDFSYVNNSYMIDQKDDKSISFYLEIEKNNGNFSLSEIIELKKKLPDEFKEKMNNLINPIFLPRNEEEILRNIIVLSKQLKYVKDIPQIIISYEKQSSKEMFFFVILLRLVKDGIHSIKDLFSYSQTFLKFSLDESKVIGLLKNKYPKEVNIFRVSLPKTSFLRRDYSLDLRKARQSVVKELGKVIGEFRDFNGGMLSKQCEALESLKALMPNQKKSSEFLLENFFYSIRPGIMQSILEANILKKFFNMLVEVRKKNYEKNNFLIITEQESRHYFVMIKTNINKNKEDVILAINKLKFKSFELVSSSIDINDEKTLGYILIGNDQEKRDLLFQEIQKALLH